MTATKLIYVHHNSWSDCWRKSKAKQILAAAAAPPPPPPPRKLSATVTITELKRALFIPYEGTRITSLIIAIALRNQLKAKKKLAEYIS